jgi:hypothetical protein
MDKNKKEIALEAMKALNDLEDTIKMENLVKDNKIEFIIENKTYRVRKPTFTEHQEMDTVRRKKYLEMINDDSYMFKNQWITKYLAKGINIVEKEKRILSLQEDIKSTLLRLATAELSKDIESLKKEIHRLREEQFGISMEVTDLLSYSIENQSLLYVNSYTTFLVLEEKTDTDWKRVYSNYEEFKKSDSKVINEAFYYLSYLIYSYNEKK